MILFQKIINQKLNSISVEELLQYAKQFNVAIDRTQAAKVVSIINGQNINIFNHVERKQLLNQIAAITSPETANEVNAIFQKFIK
ncbi:DUF2624 domain-containing protein [Metabacillus niabensis]|uniref:DNA-directed RNA polymerase subunit F n=1 Tax=Metabacillus niabensis TaxID=324854 RepID=A0ABT9YXY2_9BACI|nr:DUF2624 domain-containing protein [Metabacillus niabensis]MDQ0224848.1 DNA-directed RNA polymerase subunit F [Metabacillus niabensis]PAD66898.1 tRNA methyltransferase [Bacillus sp. 7586-K]